MIRTIETRRYRLTFTEPILGTVPKSREAFSKFVSARTFDADDAYLGHGEDELEMVPEGGSGEAAKETGFYTDEKGIYLLDYQVGGFLREAANVCRDVLGVKALRSKVRNYVFVEPRKIYLAPAPDGRIERPLRAMTMRGPRVTMAVSDYVAAGRSIEIEVTVLPHKELSWELIEGLLDYGKWQGIGQWRSGGFGRFTWERLTNGKPNERER